MNRIGTVLNDYQPNAFPFSFLVLVGLVLSLTMCSFRSDAATLYTAVSRKVVQQKSIKAYATIPKGMMGCGCSLLHRQVHEFSARGKAVL